MKPKEIFKINDLKGLEKELFAKREELRKFRFAVAQAKTKDIKTGLRLRRDIARVLTRMRQLSNF